MDHIVHIKEVRKSIKRRATAIATPMRLLQTIIHIATNIYSTEGQTLAAGILHTPPTKSQQMWREKTRLKGKHSFNRRA